MQTIAIELPKSVPVAIIISTAIIWALKGVNEGIYYCGAMWGMYLAYLIIPELLSYIAVEAGLVSD